MSQLGKDPIKIVLIDDHQVVRGGLRMLIETQPGMIVVGEAATCSEGLVVIERVHPDIVLLDLDLNNESGLDLLPKVNTNGHLTHILVLTGVRELELHRSCVRLGARGLLQKDVTAEVLVKAIRRVHAGEVWFDRSMMSSVLVDVLNQRSARNADPEVGKIETLTDREHQVIALVCQGLRNKQIAERLFISDTTVRHHLTSIFNKLELSDRLELVIYSFKQRLAAPPA